MTRPIQSPSSQCLSLNAFLIREPPRTGFSLFVPLTWSPLSLSPLYPWVPPSYFPPFPPRSQGPAPSPVDKVLSRAGSRRELYYVIPHQNKFLHAWRHLGLSRKIFVFDES